MLAIACAHLFWALQYALFTHGSITNFSPSGSSLSVGLAEDDSLLLEPINGTRDYRINSKKDHYDKPWFDSRDFRFIHCVRTAKCEKLRNNTCFGSKLPYSFTSLALTDSFSQEGSQEKLYNYEALRNIPKCWAVIQVSRELKMRLRLYTLLGGVIYCPRPPPPPLLFHFSHFCVPSLRRNASASKTVTWSICHRWKCVASHWSRVASSTIPVSFRNSSNATRPSSHRNAITMCAR